MTHFRPPRDSREWERFEAREQDREERLERDARHGAFTDKQVEELLRRDAARKEADADH